MSGHCVGKCWDAADGAGNLTIWMVMNCCAGLCDRLAQFSSIKIGLVFKSVCCFLNVLLKLPLRDAYFS